MASSKCSAATCPVVVARGRDRTQHRVRIGLGWIKVQCAPRFGTGRIGDVLERAFAIDRQEELRQGELGVGRRVLGVQGDRLLEAFPGAAQGRADEPLPVIPPALQCFVRARIRLVGRRPGQCDLECHGNGGRDVVLNREHVCELTVVAFRPQMGAILGGDQLCGDPHAAPRSPDAPFEDVGHVESTSDPPDVFVFALERKRRCARDHFQSRDMREHVDDFFGESVAEILVIRIAAHVCEGQHGDRGLRVYRRDSAGLRQRRSDLAHRLIPSRRVLGETPLNDPFEGGQRSQRRGVVTQYRAQDLRNGVPAEGARRLTESRRGRGRN